MVSDRRSSTGKTSFLTVYCLLTSRISMTAGYYRRRFGNFLANDNQFVTPADFSPYCVAAPVDPQLPGGGGNQICGLYDVSPPFLA